MVVGPSPDGRASSGAGNDLVCIRLMTGREPFTFILDAGPGDDRVFNESTHANTRLTAVLGTGADTYVGSDVAWESVIAGASVWPRQGDTSDVETDSIDTRGGDDSVYSGSVTPGANNRDSLALGEGVDRLHFAGEQVGPAADLGGSDNALVLYPGLQGTTVDVDASQRLATVDARPALRWTGVVTSYSLLLDNLRTRFTGTDSAERLMADAVSTTEAGGVAPPPNPELRRDVDMRGGDDTVALSEVVSGSMIDARGALARVNGRGGRDVLSASISRGTTPEKWRAVIRGGDGADQITGSYQEDRLIGGAGRDRVYASAGSDLVLGGTGKDRLWGGKRADRLFGGTGRDRANGEGGRDTCSAEVRRSCER